MKREILSLLITVCLIVPAVKLFVVIPLEKPYHLRCWKICRFEGQRAFILNDLDRSAQLYGEAVAEGQKVEPDSAEFADTLCEHGTVLAAANRVSESEQCYKQALSICQRHLGDAKEQWPATGLVKALSGLASLYDARGLKTQSNPLYEQIVELAASRWSKTGDITLTTQLVQAFLVVGTAYQSRGRLADAEALYKRAQALADETAVPYPLVEQLKIHSEQLPHSQTPSTESSEAVSGAQRD